MLIIGRRVEESFTIRIPPSLLEGRINIKSLPFRRLPDGLFKSRFGITAPRTILIQRDEFVENAFILAVQEQSQFDAGIEGLTLLKALPLSAFQHIPKPLPDYTLGELLELVRIWIQTHNQEMRDASLKAAGLRD